MKRRDFIALFTVPFLPLPKTIAANKSTIRHRYYVYRDTDYLGFWAWDPVVKAWNRVEDYKRALNKLPKPGGR